MSNILEVRKLEKKVSVSKGNEMRILRGIDLDIVDGEFVAIMGPSGSGKSTLLYNISGMDRMSAGSVKLGNQELAKMSEKELAALRLEKMGFIFQNIHLLKNLNLIDNVILPAYQAGKIDRKKLNTRAVKLMTELGIERIREHDITQVSGGQLQRAGICRALINEPTIIFGDEPTGALNSKATGEVLDILARINAGGTTVVVATHDVKVAARSERVIYMLDGKIQAEKYMGKYDAAKSDVAKREEVMQRWLKENGF